MSRIIRRTTFILPFPIYPPETSWMREPRTNLPGLIVHTAAHGSPIAYFPADLDRRYARVPSPIPSDLPSPISLSPLPAPRPRPRSLLDSVHLGSIS